MAPIRAYVSVEMLAERSSTTIPFERFGRTVDSRACGSRPSSTAASASARSATAGVRARCEVRRASRSGCARLRAESSVGSSDARRSLDLVDERLEPRRRGLRVAPRKPRAAAQATSSVGVDGETRASSASALRIVEPRPESPCELERAPSASKRARSSSSRAVTDLATYAANAPSAASRAAASVRRLRVRYGSRVRRPRHLLSARAADRSRALPAPRARRRRRAASRGRA